jgi:RNA polymerase sigma-70 factor, ECF subfamily
MNRAMTEKQLIEELRCGNESAFRRIYDRHYVPLCRFADLFLHDASLSEEVVDDAIFYLWEHRSEVEVRIPVRHVGNHDREKSLPLGCRTNDLDTSLSADLEN